jgi:hypothetical protein
MDRDVAIRIDGMLIGVSGSLNGIANYVKNNLSERNSASWFIRSENRWLL